MRRCAAIALLGVLYACSGPPSVPPAGSAVDPPAPPAFAPCPPGWRVVPPPAPTEVPTCDPWPAGGPLACAPDEAHFAGEPACSRIGAACPAGEWPEGLPSDRRVVYVRSAAVGGDGSLTTPFGTIGEALAGAQAGDVLALARGVYDEAVQLPAAVTLWGACVAETLIASSAFSDTAGTINVAGPGAAIRNLTVGGTRPGVWMVFGTASLDLEDVLIAGTEMGAVLLAGGGMSLTARNLVIRGTGGSTHGQGLHLEWGARAEVSRAVIERNHDIGVYAGGAGTQLTLADVAVRDTAGQTSDGLYGRGINVESGATATIDRAVVERSRDYGVFIHDAGTVARLTDVVVRDTLSEEATLGSGRGLEAGAGAQVEARRVLVERSLEIGVLAIDPGTSLVLADAVVRWTLGREGDGDFGEGLGVIGGARATVERADLFENRKTGVSVIGPGVVVAMTDVRVRNTASRAFARDLGRGFNVQFGAIVMLDRVELLDNRDGGLVAFDPATSVGARNFVVRGTLAQECAVDTCAALAAGMGVVAVAGAQVDLRRFAVTDSALCGVQLVRGATVDLHEGEVARNPIGANVQTAGFDAQRLGDQVVFRDNGRNLDTSTLPVPEPVVPAGP